MAIGMSSWMAAGLEEWGGRPVARTVAAAGPRRRALLSGTVVAVRTSRRSVPGAGPPKVPGRPGTSVVAEADLDDGTGRLVLRWAGRDQVPGVVAGASLVVEGTVLDDRGRRVLLNPLYRFAAQSSSSW